jgi:hypothetical protein
LSGESLVLTGLSLLISAEFDLPVQAASPSKIIAYERA